MHRKLGAQKAKYRVLVADDHPVVRLGLTPMPLRFSGWKYL
jgi:hypothetical protein